MLTSCSKFLSSGHTEHNPGKQSLISPVEKNSAIRIASNLVLIQCLLANLDSSAEPPCWFDDGIRWPSRPRAKRTLGQWTCRFQLVLKWERWASAWTSVLKVSSQRYVILSLIFICKFGLQITCCFQCLVSTFIYICSSPRFWDIDCPFICYLL